MADCYHHGQAFPRPCAECRNSSDAGPHLRPEVPPAGPKTERLQ